MRQAVEAGDQDKSLSLAKSLLDGGTDPLKIIGALTQVMDRIGGKFARLEIFLPEMMMSGEAMANVVKLLTPHLKKGGAGQSKGKVVLGAVKGDLHEIGKNIVKLMLETQFFEVKDVRDGELAPGAFADLIALPFAGKVADIYDAILHHAGDVAASMIDGRWALPPA